MVKRRGKGSPPTKPACGVWPFLLPDTDPFHSACVWHDNAYDNVNWEKGTKLVDYHFLGKMLDIAGTDKKLRKRAYRFYWIARQWGKMRWVLANKFGIYPKSCPCQRD